MNDEEVRATIDYSRKEDFAHVEPPPTYADGLKEGKRIAFEVALRLVEPPDIPLPTTEKPTIEELEAIINSAQEEARNLNIDILPDGRVVLRPDELGLAIRRAAQKEGIDLSAQGEGQGK